MSANPVFCPKCGLQSMDGLRFCKRCGTNLEAVSKILTGALAPVMGDDQARVALEVEYGRQIGIGLRKLLGGLALAGILYIAFHQWWVIFLLFPVAFAARDLIAARLIKDQVKDPRAALAALRSQKRRRKHEWNLDLPEISEPVPLPPAPVANYVPPEVPATGELFESSPPPSVTEHTTHLLDEEKAARSPETSGSK